MNSNNMFRILLSVAIIVAFFLPWFKFGNISGLDIITTKEYMESTATTIEKFSYVLIPFFALIILIRSVRKQFSGFLLRLLPFLIIAILTALLIVRANEAGGTTELSSWFQVFGIGYYIATISSLLLVFAGGKS